MHQLRLVGLAAGVTAVAGLGVGAVSAVTAWRIVRPNRASRPAGWVPLIDPSGVEPVSFEAPGGPSLRGWLMAPKVLGAPMVVCLHGFFDLIPVCVDAFVVIEQRDGKLALE